MTLRDFAEKQARIVRRDGPAEATRRATLEALRKGHSKLVAGPGTPIWESDWDVCLVLDACRADTYAEVLATRAGSRGYLDGSATGRSVGSSSPEWIAETFAEEHRAHWEDAAYVTANPFSGKSGDEGVFLDPEIYPLSERGIGHLDEVWRDRWQTDTRIETVDPAVLTERAMAAWRDRYELGVDRLVVHYMQPHIPFRRRPGWFDGWESFGIEGGKDPWHMLRDGELPKNEFMACYEDNLRWVLEYVDEWRERTEAEVLVMSDHGNARGEWGVWAHPPGSSVPALREVPWSRFRGTGERDLDPGPVASPASRGGDVEERLAALGYK